MFSLFNILDALAEVIAMNNETFVSGSFSPVTAKYDNTGETN